MGNEYGQEVSHKIYRVVANGQIGAFEVTYGLIHVRSFDELSDAETWIDNEGERKVDYTIMKVVRNK